LASLAIVATDLPSALAISREELALLRALLEADISSILEAESVPEDELKNVTPTERTKQRDQDLAQNGSSSIDHAGSGLGKADC